MTSVFLAWHYSQTRVIEGDVGCDQDRGSSLQQEERGEQKQGSVHPHSHKRLTKSSNQLTL